MTRFFLGRLAATLPVLALVLVIVFSLARLIPGDPAVTLLGPGATDAPDRRAARAAQARRPGPGAVRGLRRTARTRRPRDFAQVGPAGAARDRTTPARDDRTVAARDLIALCVGIPLGVCVVGARERRRGPRPARSLARRRIDARVPDRAAAAARLRHRARLAADLGAAQSYDITESVTGFAVLDGVLTTTSKHRGTRCATSCCRASCWPPSSRPC